MADAKWIGELTADMPFSKAASRVLSVRLDAVAERLPLAVHHSDEDREHVHQLRVSTRRAGAAVRIFDDVLGRSAERAIRRRLKAIRRAAGAARDWDVFQDMIGARSRRAVATHRPALDFLMGYAHAQRQIAQRDLADLQPLVDGKFEKTVAATLDAIADRDETFASRAAPIISTLLRELDAAAARNLDDYENLHRVRILGKQLRYAMEIFAPCFEGAFRDEIYPEVEQMQEILGDANDSFVAAGRLETIAVSIRTTQPKEWPRHQPGLEALQRSHIRRLPTKRREFLEWWTRWQSSGLERRLEELVAK